MFKKYVVSDRFLTGLTLVEILLVVGILAILVTSVSPLAFDFYKSQQLDSCSQGIIQTLRRAQLKAMSSENDSSFGVYLTDDSYILFKVWALTHGYKPGLTIDRINNDGDYEPNNCQFITRSENTRKRNGVIL